MSALTDARNLSELAAVGDDDGLLGGAAAAADGLDGLDDVLPLDDLAEDDVLAVEPWCHDGGQEELHRALTSEMALETQDGAYSGSFLQVGW